MKTALHLLLSCSFFAALGCGGGAADRPELVPVSGQLIYQGKPVADAAVAFWGEGAPRPAKGVTDAEGKFSLSMFEFNDGAMPGSNKVTVSKAAADSTAAGSNLSTEQIMADPTAVTDSYVQQMGDSGANDKDKDLIPKKYASQTTTTIVETVSADGENVIMIQLTE